MGSLLILEDARSKPELFHWFGRIAPGVFETWLREHDLLGQLPEDLLALWLSTGGGDYFESETILGPFGKPEMGDDVVGRNAALHADGLSPNLLVFSRGVEWGAVDKLTGEFVELDREDYSVQRRFSSLDHWYVETARADFAETYNLPPAKWPSGHDPSGPSAMALALREAWFHEYTTRLDRQPAGLPLRCPCCFSRTLKERGGDDICPVCFWHDDGQDDYDADIVRGGPNSDLSLTAARSNYREFGACQRSLLEHVRPPRPDELPEPGTG